MLSSSVILLIAISFVWSFEILKPLSKIRRVKLGFKELPPLPGFTLTTEKVRSMSPGMICAKQNFSDLTKCCNKEKEIFFSDRDMELCGDKDGSKFSKYVLEYELHKSQNPFDNNINLGQSNVVAKLLPAMCYVECLFRLHSMLYVTTIHYDRVFDHLSKAFSDDTRRTMLALINKCRLNVELFQTRILKTKFKECLMKPLLLMQCIRKDLLFACPNGQEVKNKKKCPVLMKALKECEVL